VSSFKLNSDNSSIAIDLTKSQPKATAIVAPLVPRKMHQFEEITNFVDTKPPFKSATLGRPRPINWRNKDEKSEKSVKDKIAMFSNSTSDISHILPKTPTSSTTTLTNGFLKAEKTNLSHRFNSFAKSTENIFGSSDVNGSYSSTMMMKSKVNGCGGGGGFKKKAMSVENLDDYDVVDDGTSNDFGAFQLNYQPVSKPASLHSPALTARPLTLNIGKAMSVENLIDSPALPSRPPPSSAPALARRISFSGYTNSQIEENRKSITNILENRKKSMSKLRGLVIPEKVSEADQKVLDLPVIRSKECELISANKIFNRSVSLQCKRMNVF
jgi:interleukin 16